MNTEAMKLALEALAVKFSEGWHEGIKIDASDIMLLNDAAQSLAEQPAQQEPVAYGMWDTMLGKSNRMMMVRLDREQDGCTVPLYTSPPARQEPVAYLCENAVGHKYFRWKKPSSTYKPIALYTSPPAQRTWVNLTPQNLNEIFKVANTGEGAVHLALKLIKEKNT